MKLRLASMGLALGLLSAASAVYGRPVPRGSASQDIQHLFDGARAYRQVAALVEFGKRVAGGPVEKAAAAQIAAEMESYGLEVEVQEFPLTFFEDYGSELEVIGGPVLSPATMLYSPLGEFTEEIVFCQLGTPEDLEGLDLGGKIALMERGVIPYSSKIANVAAKGAVAGIVFNHSPGIMYATLGSMADIPAVSLSQEEGQLLLQLLGQGAVQVHFLVDSVYYDSSSQNVIATLPGTDPRGGIVYMGAHYDSVWHGPGANDNASGLGCLLEAARVLSTKGHETKATIKFMAFGAEEVGMVGSATYVFGNEDEVTMQGVGMVNLDMVGVGETLLLGNIGWSDPKLAIYAQEKAEAMGIEAWEAAGMSPNSDHAYFESVGLPVVRFEQSPDPWYHSADDTLDKIDPALLQANGALATAVVYDWAKNPRLRARKASLAGKRRPAAERPKSFQAR